MSYPPYHLRNDLEVYPPPYKSTLYNDLWRLSNLDPLGTPSSRWRLSEMSLDGPYRDEAAPEGWADSANAGWLDFCSAFERTQSFIEISGLTLLATIETPLVTPRRHTCPLRDSTTQEYAKDTSNLESNFPKLYTAKGVIDLKNNATKYRGHYSKTSLITQSPNNTMNTSIPGHLTTAEVHDTQPTHPWDSDNTLATRDQSYAKHEYSETCTNNVPTASIVIHPRCPRGTDLNTVKSKTIAPEKRRPFDHAEPKDQLDRNFKGPPPSHSFCVLQSSRSQPQTRSQPVIITNILAQPPIAACLPEEYQCLPAPVLVARPSLQKFWSLLGLGPIHFTLSGNPDLHGFLSFGYAPTAGEGSGNGNHSSNPGGDIWSGRGLGMESHPALYQNLYAAREHHAKQISLSPGVSTARIAHSSTSALPHQQPRIYPDPPPPINAPRFREYGYYHVERFDRHHGMMSMGMSGNQAWPPGPTPITRHGHTALHCSAPGVAWSSRQTNTSSSLLGQENYAPNAFHRAAPPPLPAQPIGTPAPRYLSQAQALRAERAAPGHTPAFEVSPHLDARTEPSSGARHFSRNKSSLAAPVDRSASVMGIVPPSDPPVYEARRISTQNITPPLPNSGATSEQKRTKRQHQCNTCEKSYPKPYLLRDHMATHIGGPKPHPCNFEGCSAAFASRSNMKKHFNKEHYGRGSSQHVPESASTQARRGATEKTPVAGPSAHDPAFGADFQHSGQATNQSSNAAVKKYPRLRHRR